MKNKIDFAKCDCGCTTYWVSITDKNPSEGVCRRCRKTVKFITKEAHDET